MISAAYDLSVAGIVERLNSNDIMIPSFQRGFIWDRHRRSQLIESLLVGLPIPALFFLEEDDGVWQVIDGQQRLLSISSYVQGEYALSGLELLPDVNGMTFSQLSPPDQRRILSATLRATVVLAESNPAMRYELFKRLNTGGVALNEQEVRSALYPGPTSTLLRELAAEPTFLALLGWQRARDRGENEELVLRFFALHERLLSYRPPMSLFLNRWLNDHQAGGLEPSRSFDSLFRSTLEKVQSVFGAPAFRLVNHDGKQADRSPNRAVYEAQMLALSHTRATVRSLAEKAQTIRANFSHVCADPAFVAAVRTSTTDRKSSLFRVQAVAGALIDAELTVDLPG